MTILLLITFIALCIGIELIHNYRKRKVIERYPIVTKSSYKLKQNKVLVPQGLYFGTSHTWAQLMESGLVRVGLDDFLKHIIGSVSGNSLAVENKEISKNQILFTLEQDGKKLEIPAPISGKIIRRNPEVLINPAKILTTAYEDRWVFELEPANWIDETKSMMLGQKASKWMQSEFLRLKEFFAYSMNKKHPQIEYATILQDGGEVAEKVLQYADSDQWKDFQSAFINQIPFGFTVS